MDLSSAATQVALVGTAAAVLLLTGLVAGALLVRRSQSRRAGLGSLGEDVKQLRLRLDVLGTEVSAMGRGIAQLGQVPTQAAVVQDQIARVLDNLGQVRSVLTEEQSRHAAEEQAWRSLQRLEGMLLNAGQRGIMGEHIVRQIFAGLPADWWMENFQVRNAVVEFALRLPDGTYLPVDSKFPAPQAALDAAELPADDPRRSEMESRLRAAVQARLRDIGKYTDAVRTVGFGVLALPDAAYRAALPLIPGAYTTHRAMLVPYTLLGPYLLSIYQYHLRFGRTPDQQRISRAVDELGRHLDLAATQVQQLGGLIGAFETSQKRLRGELAEVRAALSALARPEAPAPDSPDGGPAR